MKFSAFEPHGDSMAQQAPLATSTDFHRLPDSTALGRRASGGAPREELC